MLLAFEYPAEAVLLNLALHGKSSPAPQWQGLWRSVLPLLCWFSGHVHLRPEAGSPTTTSCHQVVSRGESPTGMMASPKDTRAPFRLSVRGLGAALRFSFCGFEYWHVPDSLKFSV